MRKFRNGLVTLGASIALLAGAACDGSPSMTSGEAALRGDALRASTGIDWIVHVDPQYGTVDFAAPKRGPAKLPSAASPAEALIRFLEEHRTSLRMEDPAAELTFERDTTTSDGSRHIHCQQRIAGLEVRGAVWSAHLDPKGALESMSGRYVPALDALDTEARISPATAEAAAKADILARYSGLPASGMSSPKTQLLVEVDTGTPRLVYDVRISVRSPQRGEYAIYSIDAHDGSVLRRTDGRLHARQLDAQGSLAHPPFNRGGDNKKVPVSDDSVAVLDAVVGTGRVSGKGVELRVVTRSARDSGSAPIPNQSADDTSWADSTSPKGHAVDAQAHAARVLLFYREMFDWYSWDGQGAPLNSFINDSAEDPKNAYWDPFDSSIHYGDGTDVFFPVAASLDTVAHEITHGVTQATSGLEYVDGQESASIDEAMSDVFAALFSHYRGESDDLAFKFSEDSDITHSPFRDLARPKSAASLSGDSQLDHQSEFTSTSSSHSGSTIVGNAFFLMVHGGVHSTGRRVPCGIGWDAGGKLFWALQTAYMTSSETFARMALDSLSAAKKLSIPLEPIACAWVAVGALEEETARSSYDVACPAAESDGSASDGGAESAEGGLLVAATEPLIECTSSLLSSSTACTGDACTEQELTDDGAKPNCGAAPASKSDAGFGVLTVLTVLGGRMMRRRSKTRSNRDRA